MGFGGPKISAPAPTPVVAPPAPPPPPPPPPQLPDEATQANAAAASAQQRYLARRGMGGTILTSGLGVVGGNYAKKTLLGAGS